MHYGGLHGDGSHGVVGSVSGPGAKPVCVSGRCSLLGNVSGPGIGVACVSGRCPSFQGDPTVSDVFMPVYHAHAQLTESVQKGKMGRWAHLDWSDAREREAAVVESFQVFGAPVERSTVQGGTELPVLEVCAVKAAETAEPQARVRLVLHGGRERDIADGTAVNFAPEGDLQAASPTEIRTVTVIAKARGLFSAKADVRGAYLNTPCEQEVYARLPLWLLTRLHPEACHMRQPVCPLLRMLYGKQDSGFAWDRLLSLALGELGWTRDLTASAAVWRQHSDEFGAAFLAVYIDDVLLAAQFP